MSFWKILALVVLVFGSIMTILELIKSALSNLFSRAKNADAIAELNSNILQLSSDYDASLKKIEEHLNRAEQQIEKKDQQLEHYLTEVERLANSAVSESMEIASLSQALSNEIGLLAEYSSPNCSGEAILRLRESMKASIERIKQINEEELKQLISQKEQIFDQMVTDLREDKEIKPPQQNYGLYL